MLGDIVVFFTPELRVSQDLQISLLGELRVNLRGAEAPLPASRKARGLLAFPVATGRPHRRERLCELFWDLPDDPKAALRWSLSKLRKVVDSPDKVRIIADRERVHFDAGNVAVDIKDIHELLRRRDANPGVEQLETMAGQLEPIFLDGLDGAGDEAFDSWMMAEREDVRLARISVLRQLATHPQIAPASAKKWFRLWADADPTGAQAHDRESEAAPKPEPGAAETARGGGGKGEVGNASASDPPAMQTERPKISSMSRALRAQRIGFWEVRDGTKIAYATVGSGMPLLKAANWLNHLEFDWGSPIWGKGFAALARYRNSYATTSAAVACRTGKSPI